MNPERAYQQVMLFLARVYPQLYFLSKQFKIVYIDEEMPKTPIWTDGKTILLTKSWVSGDLQFRIVSFMHELYHNLLKHPIRAYNLINAGEDPMIVILACDSKTNYCVKQALLLKKVRNIEAYDPFIYTFGVPEDLLEKASVEEIVEYLKKLYQSEENLPNPTFGNDIKSPEGDGGCGGSSGSGESESDSGGGEGEGEGENESREGGGGSSGGEGRQDIQDGKGKGGKGGDQQTHGQVLNEGDSKLVNAVSSEELESALNSAIRKALISAKMAGSALTSIEERVLTELTKPKVDWRVVFRNSIINYVRELVVISYRYANRRVPHLPGHQPISKPRVWSFVDVSGSITPKEFDQFISEVYYISKEASDVKVITWDTEVTGEYDLRDRSALTKIKFKGGGETKFVPAIIKYLKRINPTDVVVVLTDGYWFDLKEAEEILKNLRAYKVLVTTEATVNGFDKVIKIRAGE